MCHNHDNLRSNNKDLQAVEKQLDRRNFLTKTSMGLGAIALGSLLNAEKAFTSPKNINIDATQSDACLNHTTRIDWDCPIICQKPNASFTCFKVEALHNLTCGITSLS